MARRGQAGPRPPALPPLVAIFGPTGTGKTELACRLADEIRCHLVSCDAVQVYRGLDAATAKPRGDALRHPWALVDCADPRADFDLGTWVRAAERELDAARAARRVPVVAGGSGLYLRGLLKGVHAAPRRDPRLRARLERLADRRGTDFLHRVLTRLAPPGAAGLTPRDRQRLVRALEVRLLTGRGLEALHGWRWRGPDRMPALRLGLRLDRESLYARLDRRVEEFFAAGLVREVAALLADGVPPAANAFKAIGYREVLDWLAGAGAASREPPAELIRLVQRNTRRYAKRQVTWFRSEKRTVWLDADGGDVLERALIEVRRFLGSAAGQVGAARDAD